jgi:hypothetical protein
MSYDGADFSGLGTPKKTLPDWPRLRYNWPRRIVGPWLSLGDETHHIVLPPNGLPLSGRGERRGPCPARGVLQCLPR